MSEYITEGVCASKIRYVIHDHKIAQVEFEGGCDGNLQAIAKLVAGMPVPEVITKLKGIRCGNKPTSCADQLARALIANSIKN